MFAKRASACRLRSCVLPVETVQKYYKETGSRMKVVFHVFKLEDLTIYREVLSR